VLSAGLAGLVAVAPAAEPAPPASAVPGLPDVVLARSALAALDAEPELRGVNLVVSVVDGVAVLGGPVPNAAVSKHAEKVIRKIDGMKDVRNACFVSTGPDPFLKAVADKSATTLPPRPVMGELPGVLGNPLPAPVSPFPVRNNGAVEANSVVIARRPTLPVAGAAGVLGAPVGPAISTPPPTLNNAAGTLTGASLSGIQLAIAEAKKSESRFANLTADIRDGVVVVVGSAPLAADAWDFARKMKGIPGVNRVVIGAVAGK
jgi:hypothetical protein